MAITPWTQGAVAPRFDIYDPFPFQEVASMALRKDKSYDDFMESVNKYSTDLAKIETASGNDRDHINKMISNIETKINKAVSEGTDFGEGIAANQFMRDIRKDIDMPLLTNIQKSTSNINAYKQSTIKLGKDWVSELDNTSGPIESHDSKNGVWQGTATEKQDWQPLLDRMLKNKLITETYADNGVTSITGISPAQRKTAAKELTPQFLSSPEGEQAIDLYILGEQKRGRDLSNATRTGMAEEFIKSQIPEGGQKDISLTYRINAEKAKSKNDGQLPVSPLYAMFAQVAANGVGKTTAASLQANFGEKVGDNSVIIKGSDIVKQVNKFAVPNEINSVVKKETQANAYNNLKSAEKKHLDAIKDLNNLIILSRDEPSGALDPYLSFGATIENRVIKQTEQVDILNKALDLAKKQAKEVGVEEGKVYEAPTKKETVSAFGSKMLQELLPPDIKVLATPRDNDNTRVVALDSRNKIIYQENTVAINSTDFDKLITEIQDASKDENKEYFRFNGLDKEQLMSTLGIIEGKEVDRDKITALGGSSVVKELKVYRWNTNIPLNGDPNTIVSMDLNERKRMGFTNDSKDQDALASLHGADLASQIIYLDAKKKEQDDKYKEETYLNLKDKIKEKGDTSALQDGTTYQQQLDFINNYESENK